jgi:triosephosphate isomerase
MNKLLVANWKLNPEKLSVAVKLAKAIDKKCVVICPPFPFLAAVGKVLKYAKLGAQDVFWEDKGAYTGEVSPMMLKDLGVKYVIIGHSERRRWLQETDEMIGKKVAAVLRVGLKVILCVGEPWSIRKKGLAAAKSFVRKQLKEDLRGLPLGTRRQASDVTIAYEPVWAIGTGRSDKPAETVEMAKFIKQFLHSTFYILNSRILYGGSVDSKNVGNFIKYREVDGALVGGASLKADEFKEIINISAEYD